MLAWPPSWMKFHIPWLYHRSTSCKMEVKHLLLCSIWHHGHSVLRLKADWHWLPDLHHQEVWLSNNLHLQPKSQEKSIESVAQIQIQSRHGLFYLLPITTRARTRQLLILAPHPEAKTWAIPAWICTFCREKASS